MNHAVLLKILIYLKGEDQYIPWLPAYKILSKNNRYISSDKNYDDFKSHLAQMVMSVYNKLGVNEIPGEPYYNQLTRILIINLACLIGLEYY